MLTQEQIDARLNFVTGSDAAVICGLSPFKTRVQLWMEKTGRVLQNDISNLNHIKFGNFFEDGVARWFEAESGKKLRVIQGYTPSMLIHKSLPWMAGNVDRFLVSENAILECKTALHSEGWGDGENIIPDYYLMQVAHYCAVGGFDRAYIAVVFAAQREMRWYQYDRNLALEDKLINREQDFWINNVKADVCPDPVNEHDILALYKETKADPVIADGDISWKPAMIHNIQNEIKELEKRLENHKKDLQLFMKDHDTLLDTSGKILATWKYTKPIKYFDNHALKHDNIELWGQYMKQRDGSRRFRVLGENE